MSKRSIYDIKKYIESKYHILPTREGISISGDPFLAYTKKIKHFLKRSVYYEFYIETYEDIDYGVEGWSAAVYSISRRRKLEKVQSLYFSTLEDFEQKTKEIIKNFLQEITNG